MSNGLRSALRRRLGIVLVVFVLLLLLSANRIALFATELWWFRALDFSDVYTDILISQFGLGIAFGAIVALVLALNLVVARRVRPIVLPASQREAVIERYRQLADPYVPWLIALVAVLFAVSLGTAAAAEWPRYLLWRHGGDFGVTDPQFGRDVGFYVFDLPWLRSVQGWLFTLSILALVVTAAAHYLLGAIRPEAPRERVSPQAKAHLSVLLAAVLAVRGWGYWLGRFELNFSPRGTVTGASYTDVNAELPALNLLLLATVVAVVLTLINIRRRGFLLPGAAIALLVVVSVLGQGLYPAAIQRLRVAPQELPREEPFIERNLEATRAAYGLDEVGGTRFEVENDLAPEDVDEHEITLNNVRLWSPQVLGTTYQQLQAIRLYYQFHDVDVDRYPVGDDVRQTMVSVRELNTQGLEEAAQTWQNIHLTYTHGYGFVSSQVNTATGEGQPVFLSRDIPPRGPVDALVPEVPGVYYGEVHSDYSLVQTTEQELDFESSETGEQVTTRYDGAGGVAIGGALRRVMFALRFADPNLVLSGLITGESRIIFHRAVQDRIERIAPFLTLDRDPYAVVIDDRIVWIIDGYTTSATYPYSERRIFHNQAVNYVRNSVKAVVDAYDGTVTLYVVDPDDPVLQAWREAFPAPFADVSEAPEELVAHFRYPEDMFTLQADVYRTYHIPGAPAFYSKADAWDIPPDASAIANGDTSNPQLDPYYLLMRLPGQEIEEFVLIQPYLARTKPNMIAWLAGRSDPAHYGELFAVQFPSDQAILGPEQAQARIEQDPEISEYITLRTRAGSEVIRGDLLVIPIERSVLYVEPLFIENPQAQIPELAQVTLVLGDDVVMASTLSAALNELIGAAPEDPVVPGAPGEEDPTEDPEDPEEPTEEQIDELLQEALEAFTAAEQALRDGDLAEYQRQVGRAEQLLADVAELRGVQVAEPGPEGTPGTAPGPSPSPAG